MTIVPIVVGALGSITKDFESWIDKLNIKSTNVVVQKSALLGTARILRKVLEIGESKLLDLGHLL